MDGVADIMSHILGSSLSPLDLSVHADEARDFVKKEIPWLKEVEFPEMPEHLTDRGAKTFVDNFVTEMAKKYGAYHEVGQVKNPPETGFAKDIQNIAKIKAGPGPH